MYAYSLSQHLKVPADQNAGQEAKFAPLPLLHGLIVTTPIEPGGTFLAPPSCPPWLAQTPGTPGSVRYSQLLWLSQSKRIVFVSAQATHEGVVGVRRQRLMLEECVHENQLYFCG